MSILKIVAPLPSISKRTRLTKIRECGIQFSQIDFFGWQRSDNEILDEDGFIILKGGGYSSKKARMMYLIWMLKVFYTALFFKKNDIVWALGFETAFPAILASKLKGFKVVYDDADRFSSLFNFPNFVKKILISLEKYSSKNCFKHIIPGEERYEFSSDNFFILKNTPTSEDIEKAENHILDHTLLSQLESFASVIYVNGWLGDGRGLKIINHIASNIPQIGFLLAGRIDSKFASEMLEYQNVIYLGELPQYKALAYYKVSDFVFTYYDPIVPINKMAEANKWGDALQFSVPVIVNSEVITADYLRKSNSCISVAYNDIDGLEMELISHLNNPEKYQTMKSSIKLLQQKFPTFDTQLEKLFKTLE